MTAAAIFPPVGTLSLAIADLGRLVPMHLLIGGDGRVRSVGPTLQKVFGVPVTAGSAFFDVFEVRHPRGIADLASLAARAGTRMTLARRGEARSFRSFAVPLADGGLIVTASFGIDLVEAVATHDLTEADFTPTDLAIEMLYLYEAKTAVMDEWREMSRRLQGAKQAAETQAMTDTLTGLANRRALDLALADAVAGADGFGLMHVDLDWFKAVNDSLGHAAGDHVLREVARVLREETRHGDCVARIGGDEFVILLMGLADRAALRRIARRLVTRLSQPFDFQGQPCRISASIGIALSTDYLAPDPDRVLRDADTALYASKNAGRGRATFHAIAPG